ncbi:MAG: DciA family protein [Methyloceanibacter sp.]|nr:DciA family protein [Methyloceanibacter sp.]
MYTTKRKPKGGPRAIGGFVEKALDRAARARGFATTALLSDWPAIAGAELARYTMPDRLIWPRRNDPWDEDGTDARGVPENTTRGHKAGGATLVLRIEGPRAIEVQHRGPQILERINAYFGYRAVTEMRFLQAPISRVRRPKRSPNPPLPAYGLPKSAGIQDKGLTRALERLGALAAYGARAGKGPPSGGS